MPRPAAVTQTPPAPEAPLLSDRIYGAVALLLVALAAFFALRGGPADGAAAGPEAAPTLTLLQAPAAHPLVLEFDAGTRLRPSPAGWGTGGRHVHARVDGAELMPGPGDLQPVRGTRYRWTLPPLPAGEHTVQLFWSDQAHRPLAEGASQPLRVRLP